ncbi:MAG TPA: SigE family RNA polymerase sigma factor [Motilibacteraceae bacterium]|nr:SigE family RNA polymerase sigma factor [Motilibacteraceae bacterium]
MSRSVEFDAFVASRSRALLQTAWLLTGDWQHAEDLVQTALAKCYPAWERIADGGDEGYVRRTLVTSYITWWRRAWHGERPSDPIPETGVATDDLAAVDVRRLLVAALGELPRRQRATVVLRYYCDLPEVETAELLGCSVGTVKSQAAKGLARLRRSSLAAALSEGIAG